MFNFKETVSTKDKAALDAAVEREESLGKKIRIISFSFIALAIFGSLTASAFFWEARTNQEIFDNATTQLQKEIDVATTRLFELKVSQFKAQKDLAIDKLKAAADKADTTEIDRLNGVLVDLENRIENVGVEINFPLVER